MRRTNSRGSRSHANGARRASSARSRTSRSKRTSRRPHLTQRQVREIAGVLLILAGLLGVLAVASHAGSILAGLQEWLVASFRRAWFVPVTGGGVREGTGGRGRRGGGRVGEIKLGGGRAQPPRR